MELSEIGKPKGLFGHFQASWENSICFFLKKHKILYFILITLHMHESSSPLLMGLYLCKNEFYIFRRDWNRATVMSQGYKTFFSMFNSAEHEIFTC